MEGIASLQQNISLIYNQKKKAAVYALCGYYAAMALQYFRQHQAKNQYWTNQTNIAMDTVFARNFKEGEAVMGWFMAHTQQYGVYLELANDRKHESLRPIIMRYYARFQADLGKIYNDN
jgi:hypothetical protein